MVANGHFVEDVKHVYTVDQVYLFYEKCKKRELEDQRKTAITLANSLVYASPSYDKSGVSKKQKMWEDFIESLNWSSIVDSAKKKAVTTEEVKNMFVSAGIPVKSRKKGD